MPQYTIESPDGRTVTVEGSEPPSESDLDEIFSSLPSKKEQPSFDATSPENLARYAAAGGGGGFVTNPRLTSSEQLKGIAGNAGIAASLIAPELAIAAIPSLAPAAAATIPGYLARLGLAGGISAGAGETVSELPSVVSGEVSPVEALKHVGKQTAIGIPFGIAGGVLGQKAIQAGTGAINRALGSDSANIGDLLSNLKQGAAEGLVRPLFETPEKVSTREAAGLIESLSGERPPQSVGEALGKKMGGGTYAELEYQLGNEASGAIPVEKRNEIARRVLNTAALLRGKGATPSVIADRTLAALEKEVGSNISGPTKDAITKMSKTASSSLEDALKSTQAEGFRLTTPGSESSPYFAGNIGKIAEQEAVSAFEKAENELYGNYRTLLGKNPPKMGLSSTESAIDSVLKGGLKTTNAAGEEVPIASTIQDADARKFLGQLQQAIKTPQDIESVRMYRSQIGESIGNQRVLSGLPLSAKKQIYRGLSQDLETAIDKIPDPRVKAAYKAANEFRKENIDKFKMSLAEGAESEFEQGGTTGQSLFRSVVSDTDKYNTFKSILGDRFPVFRDAARDAILESAQTVEPGSQFSVGEALKKIKLPKEVKADMFPQLDRLGKLAAKEVKLSGLLKGVPEDAIKSLDWMRSNIDDLREFIGPEGEQQFLDAVRLKAAEVQRFNNAVIRDVANGSSNTISKNPEEFLNSILSGTVYTKPGQVKEALDVVGRHSPSTLHDIQVEFLKRVIDSSKVKGIISGDEIAKKLATPVAGKAPTSGGPKLSVAEEILGKAKTDSIRTVAEALGTMQKNLLGREVQHQASILEMIMSSKTPVDIATLMASGPLNNRSRGLISSIFVDTPTRLKYHLAATLMNDPKLLPLVSKPVDNLSGAEAAELAGALGVGTGQQKRKPFSITAPQ